MVIIILNLTSMCQSPPVENESGFIDMRVNKSLAIPMPASHIHRTDSEVRIQEETAIAEYRDRCMLHRLVGGIRKRRRQSSNPDHDDCVRNRDNVPMFPMTDASTEETDGSIARATSTRDHLSQGFGNGTPAYSRERYRLRQSDAYRTMDEDRQPVRRHRSRGLEDWAIEGFDESMRTSNMPRDSTVTQTELIPDMYESDDSSFRDDEVFDIDL